MEDPKPIVTVKKLWGMASENDVDMLLQHLPKKKKIRKINTLRKRTTHNPKALLVGSVTRN